MYLIKIFKKRGLGITGCKLPNFFKRFCIQLLFLVWTVFLNFNELIWITIKLIIENQNALNQYCGIHNRNLKMFS